MTDIYPVLAVRDVDAAADFYMRAFSANEEGERVRFPGGPHIAVLAVAGRRMAVTSEAPDLGTLSPETVNATTVRIALDVENPDAVAQQAISAGAKEIFPVADQPYGMRQGRVVDPFGHHWLIGRPL